ncbi:MAG TPA: hypothetical protein VEB18_03295 [Candidatus Paceibacterota bacterium]|nr:hypothetical protein [Candidatus Paceibacterota bacterium]
MLDVLMRAEAALPELIPELLDPKGSWSSLAVRYHPPFVDRLWRPFEDRYRLYLHRIHACSKRDALFHPHPWPSAMRVLKGNYEMAVGYGAGSEPPPIAATFHLKPGSAYEMTDPDAWHYVRPLSDEYTYSIMVTGEPWSRTSPGTGETHRALNTIEFNNLYMFFSTHYGH